MRASPRGKETKLLDAAVLRLVIQYASRSGRRCPTKTLKNYPLACRGFGNYRTKLVHTNRMVRNHRYAVTVTWTGNRGTGTSGYRDYDRSHEISADGPPVIAGSSDPAFRGDPARWNPEQALTAALSQCHLLWYLHLCAEAGVTVLAYDDAASGTMTESADGGGRFTEVVLRPRVVVASASMIEDAMALHGQAHAKCFIANSVNFPVRHEPVVKAAERNLLLRK